MKTHKWLLCLLLLCAPVAHAGGEFYTARQLFNKMNGDIYDRQFALGYVIGAYDAANDVTMCHDRSDLRAGTVEDLVRAWLRQNSHLLTERTLASVAVNQALVELFGACSRTPSRRGTGT